MATSKDVAKLANVSVSTVSRAFRNDCYISEEMKNKVLAAAKELGYTPNLVARSLKNSKSKIIGLITSDIDNDFYSVVTRVIESELKRLGYRLLISTTNESSEEELENLNLLSSSRADGIIFTPNSARHHLTIDKIKKQNIALVQMYRRAYKDIDTVLVDDKKGTYIATNYLIQNGHTNILLLTTVGSEIEDAKNYKPSGYKQAFKEKNLSLDENKNILYFPYQTDLRMMITQQIEKIKPTAIIAGTNTIGRDVIKVCKEMKLSIPEDISVIMFDDVEWASLLDITTISQPIKDIGLIASRTLINRIEDQNVSNTPILSTLEPDLILRNSVKNLFTSKKN
ncbi:LacI family DNA-binding transcriptional regulator [Halalkalibacter kiskunsagensis]|uniref:LacI family DNA-binding transcriptional regulator n=1 Tax=Halalkalibacter kiskunsagensis TaxID=1548599 RepID=A0ABV6KCB3_9BACI